MEEPAETVETTMMAIQTHRTICIYSKARYRCVRIAVPECQNFTSMAVDRQRKDEKLYDTSSVLSYPCAPTYANNHISTNA